MSVYVAPLKDMRFVLNELAGLDELSKLPGYQDATPDTANAILQEASKFATEVLDPLNYSGDQEGSKWRDGAVTTPTGFKAAYQLYCEGGWSALSLDPEWGGQGLPKLLSTPVSEMMTSANMSFSLCPMLTQGAIEAMLLSGSEQLKKVFLPRMFDGRWTGTMNLTEPQAGSDLALVRTKAVPASDPTLGDHYRISGQKIFITFGEHDLTENIVHLVLARTPDAPEGVKGISLFIVPKFLVQADGSLGARNQATCASIEHKLGIHASPTAVMVFENAIGYLLGEENKGLSYMFIMMNAARFAVGLEGVSIAERAFQRALAYAKDRVQGRDLLGGAKAVPIIRHPDVRRMLMLMKSQTEAMRALAYVVSAAVDFSSRTEKTEERQRLQAFVDLMIPVVKGWSTETGIEVASLGVQVHGGMGFIEETGAAQHLRDARITTIYEGTTGIQANDLVGRKIAREGGVTVKEWLAVLRKIDLDLAISGNSDIQAIRSRLAAGAQAVSVCVDFILATAGKDPNAAFAGAVPFLKLMGIVAGGWQMARAALVAEKKIASNDADQLFYAAKITTARFFSDHVLSQAPGLAATVVSGAAAVMALTEDQFLSA
ncbi:MAG: acyl-CoA dehydrogenase [Betaproteobacteria bacterium]|nr:acyl-CoA dehydrogenase [Betaproteobacteria bacterium]MSQ88035.1 acyl-CoA dehydrogenase [Betaproteobacteria bacterium]